MDGTGTATSNGGIYSGTLVDGVPEGTGKITWAQRPRSAIAYKGSLHKGVKSGTGELETLPGSTFRGEFKQNMRHGAGVQSLSHDQSVFEGSFVEGELEGHGKWKFRRYLEYTGEFSSGVVNGSGEMTFADGTIYTGGFVDGMRHGEGRSLWPDGDVYEGEYRNDRRHGHGSYTWASGQRYEGGFVNGKREGLGSVSFPNGSTFLGVFRGGRRDGHGILLGPDNTADCGIWQGKCLIRLKSPLDVCEHLARLQSTGSDAPKENIIKRCLGRTTGKLTRIAIHAMQNAFYGDTLKVVRLVERNGVHPDVCTSGGVSLLMLAASQGHIETVNGLLDVGASVNWQTDEGMTTLNLSYQLVNSLELDRLPLDEIALQILSDPAHYLMLDKDGKPTSGNSSDCDANRQTAIKFCEDYKKMFDTYHLLLGRGASSNLSIFPKPIIISAVLLHDYEVVSLLLLHEASPNQIDESDPMRKGPLMYAVAALQDREGDHDVFAKCASIFELLVESGADVNQTDAALNTPLHKLAQLQQQEGIDLIDLLVRHGANVDAHNEDGDSPLSVAICCGNSIAARRLLELGADANVYVGKERNTTALNLIFTTHTHPLHAVLRLELTELLLAFKADPTIAVPARARSGVGTVLDTFHEMLQGEPYSSSVPTPLTSAGSRQKRVASPSHLAVHGERNQREKKLVQQVSRGNLRARLRAQSPVKASVPYEEQPDATVPLNDSAESARNVDRGSGTGMDARRGARSTSSSASSRRQTYAFLPGRGSAANPPSEEDLDVALLLTNSVRLSVLDKQQLDLHCCFQCGRSANQRLASFSGSQVVFFCGGRCKMRALNGPHRKGILQSLKRTNPNRWKMLQLNEDPQVVWRGENVDEFDLPPRAITAPPDFARDGKARRKTRSISPAVAQGEEEVSSRVCKTPLPNLTPNNLKKYKKAGAALKGRLNYLPRVRSTKSQHALPHTKSLSSSPVPSPSASFTSLAAKHPRSLQASSSSHASLASAHSSARRTGSYYNDVLAHRVMAPTTTVLASGVNRAVRAVEQTQISPVADERGWDRKHRIDDIDNEKEAKEEVGDGSWSARESAVTLEAWHPFVNDTPINGSGQQTVDSESGSDSEASSRTHAREDHDSSSPPGLPRIKRHTSASSENNASVADNNGPRETRVGPIEVAATKERTAVHEASIPASIVFSLH